MKAILMMYDSLNRHMLPPYGCDWVVAPNFRRLAERAVTFDSCYIGSAPTIPARRELHTGRYNFLHRSWGPLEPFDDSTPEVLKQNGITTHLAADSYHYWEEGGATYHTRYSSWEFFRGQEGEPWVCDLNDPDIPRPNPRREGDWPRQDWVNRAYMPSETDQPQAKTAAAGLRFIERNHAHDNWLLQIETFDPHEPYFSSQEFKDLYDHDFSTSQCDWPSYRRVGEEDRELTEHFRYCYAALVSMCDKYLGKVLDAMDRYDLWKDTLLIVNTDHGTLLGEHGWWGKCVMPFYEELARIPLFAWDPRSGRRGERRKSLVQTIDLPATLLEFFGLERPPDMQGLPLRETIANDRPVREAGLFGAHGGHVNVTDGRYVYLRAPAGPENQPLFDYTHMPTHMRHTFSVEEMRTATMAPPFSFTKGCPVMKIAKDPGHWIRPHEFGTLLFDTENDPKEERPLDDAALEKRMVDHLIREMKKNDAPAEQYERLGLTGAAEAARSDGG